MTDGMILPDGGRSPSPTKLLLQDQVAHLARVPLLSDSSKRDLRRLAKATRVDLLEAGQTLITEGDPSKQAYVIIAGRAVVRRGGRKVAEIGPSDITGEIALILGQPRTATVVAETPLEVLVLEQDALREAIEEVPGFGWQLLKSVAHRLADNDQQFGPK